MIPPNSPKRAKQAVQSDRVGIPSQVISARWIATALAAALAAAAVCVWCALCLTFWLGNWQLLYHPKSAITQTPANLGLAFDSVDFGASESGQPQLHGWWIPGSPASRFTGIYLHGANDDIGDVVASVGPLHAANLNLLVFDYRGYGQSRFERPSELHWRQDVEAAVSYLTGTRHIPAGAIVLIGSALGANLALEEAGAHSDLAGVVLEQPLDSPDDAVFNDPRARLVPAHMLVPDRWNLREAATRVRIPSLWLDSEEPTSPNRRNAREAYEQVAARKMRVVLQDSADRQEKYPIALAQWLDRLATDRRSP